MLGLSESIETSDEVTVADLRQPMRTPNSTSVGTIGETAVMNNSTQDDTAAKVDFGDNTTALPAVVIRSR